MFNWNEAQWFAFLAGFAIKSAMLLTAAWLATFAMQRRSAAARHAVWMASFASVLMLPVLSVVVPALPESFTRSLPGSNLIFSVTAADHGASHSGSIRSSDSAVSTHRSAPVPDARLAIILLWAIGAIAILAQTAASCAALGRRRRSARAFTPSSMQGVPIFEAPSGSMPMTFGIFRPVIFLPCDAAEWNAGRRQIVLLHELAHVRRGDAATHLVARAVLGLLWWNPLAWAAWRAFLRERERAADDLVLCSGACASEYAGHLLDVARSIGMRGAPDAAVAMARPSELEGRLLAILDSRVKRSAPGAAPVIAAIAAAALIAAPIAAVKAQDRQTPLSPDVEATMRAAYSQKNYAMLETAAARFEKIQQYDAAEKLLRSATEIRGQTSGEQSAAYAAGLMNQGDLESNRGKSDEALKFYTKALSLGDRPEVGRALIYLGARAMPRSSGVAEDYFQRALNVASNGNESGRALMWLAVLHARHSGAWTDAESLFQRSLASVAPGSAESAATMEAYANFLAEAHRSTEASDMRANAGATRKALGKLAAMEAPRATGEVYKAGGDVTPPVPLVKMEPAYTDEARAAKISGGVLLGIEIGPDGVPRNVQVLRGLGFGLDEQAVSTISQWSFQPGTKDGVPVTVSAQVEINFRLM